MFPSSRAQREGSRAQCRAGFRALAAMLQADPLLAKGGTTQAHRYYDVCFVFPYKVSAGCLVAGNPAVSHQRRPSIRVRAHRCAFDISIIIVDLV